MTTSTGCRRWVVLKNMIGDAKIVSVLGNPDYVAVGISGAQLVLCSLSSLCFGYLLHHFDIIIEYLLYIFSSSCFSRRSWITPGTLTCYTFSFSRPAPASQTTFDCIISYANNNMSSFCLNQAPTAGAVSLKPRTPAISATPA